MGRERLPGQTTGRSSLTAKSSDPLGTETAALETQGSHSTGGTFAVMARFCAYIEKIFGLGNQLGNLTDARTYPHIPTAAVFASVFTLFATRRGSLNGLEQDLRIPARLRGIVGARVPSVDSIGRIYGLMDSQPVRQILCDIAHRFKRNKALTSLEGWYVAAIDGHEFFSSRKRCCPHC